MLRTIVYTLLRSSALASPFHSNLSSASILNSFPTNTSTLSSAGYCFEPRIGRLPPNYRDCELTASQIDPLRFTSPVTFSRRPEAQFKLPKSYRSGTCIIYLDMVQDTDEDRFPLIDVWDATMNLAHACVRPDPWAGPRLGGFISVGPARSLCVVIFGRVDPHGVAIAKL